MEEDTTSGDVERKEGAEGMEEVQCILECNRKEVGL